MTFADFDDVRPIGGQACLAARQRCIQHPCLRLCVLARQGKLAVTEPGQGESCNDSDKPNESNVLDLGTCGVLVNRIEQGVGEGEGGS